jgi:hypothetical protein
MDGFDTRGLEVDRVYTVDEVLGDYLVGSSYAQLERPRHAREQLRRKTKSRKRSVKA